MPPEMRQEVSEAYDNEVCTCGDCGVEETPSETFNNVNDSGEEICNDCTDAYVSCYDCDETINEDDAYYNNGDSFCSSCHEDRFMECYSCGTEIERDDASWSDRAGDYVCDGCYDDEQCSVPDWNVMSRNFVETRTSFVNPKNDRYSKDTFNLIESKRNIGVEIETNFRDDWAFSEIEDDLRVRVGKQRNLTEEDWYSFGRLRMTGDTSTTNSSHPYGGEIVMEPRRGDVLVKDVDIVCETLQESWEAYASVKTGLHLHVDVQDYDWLHMSVLTYFTKLMEPHIFTWLPKSRWYGSGGQRWSRPVSQSVMDFNYVSGRDSFVEFYYDNGGYTDEKYNDKRYHGLNWHCHFQSNQGVELRYHSGTLQTDKIKHWSIFWTKVIDKCHEIGEFLNNDSLYQFGDSTLYTSLVVNPRIRAKCSRISDKFGHASLYSDIGKTSDIFEYRKYSEMLRRYIGLDKKEKPYKLQPMLDFVRNRHNHCVMSIDNIFEVFDIPTETRQYFMKRKSQLRNAMLPDVADQFYNDVFRNINCVVEYNDKTMMFEYKDIFKKSFQLVDVKNDYGFSRGLTDRYNVNYEMLSQYA